MSCAEASSRADALAGLARERLTGELAQARALFNALREHAFCLGVTLRATPPEPTTCCGRGCNGCVWEGYYAAAEFWREDAVLACTQVLQTFPSSLSSDQPHTT